VGVLVCNHREQQHGRYQDEILELVQSLWVGCENCRLKLAIPAGHWQTVRCGFFISRDIGRSESFSDAASAKTLVSLDIRASDRHF
jgi:hypothetical protein